jgi:hypothetical protein
MNTEYSITANFQVKMSNGYQKPFLKGFQLRPTKL